MSMVILKVHKLNRIFFEWQVREAFQDGVQIGVSDTQCVAYPPL